MDTQQRSYQTAWTTDGNTLRGIAAVYNSPAVVTERGRSFNEVIRQGAFRNALASGGDVLVTFNHDPNQMLGRTSSGTARLTDSAEGLRFEVELPDTSVGRDVKTLVSRGDLKGASFTFGVRKGGESWSGSTRELSDLYLMELGPVASPVYRDTSLSLRSLDNYRLRITLAEKI